MSETIPIGQLPTSGAAPTKPVSPNNLEQMKSLAAQFESVLLGQMMKQMRESLFSEKEEDGKASGFAGGPLADQVYSELSLALSRAGGVGLGDALGGALGRQAAGAVVSSGFGWRQDPMGAGVKFHNGTDIAMPSGSDVQAAQAGKVESVGDVPGYGLTVVITHPGGLATRYAHLSEALVKSGDAVTQGQVIAKSGSSGKSTGPHLHFEVLQDGQAVDPGRW